LNPDLILVQEPWHREAERVVIEGYPINIGMPRPSFVVRPMRECSTPAEREEIA
jgi:hypothetical protein